MGKGPVRTRALWRVFGMFLFQGAWPCLLRRHPEARSSFPDAMTGVAEGKELNTPFMDSFIFFILGILFLIVAPISGCNGYEWGKEHGEWRVRHSSEWKTVKSNSKAFEAELEAIRRKGRAEIQKRQATRETESREWEAKTRAEYTHEISARETTIKELRKQLSSLPVVESRPVSSRKPLSDADFNRRLERWANKERKNDWRQFIKAEDSAKKYRSSLAGMERKAQRTGGRVADEPGFDKASKLCGEAENTARQLRAKLVAAYADATVQDAVNSISSMLSGTGKTKSLTDRIGSLETRVKEQMEVTESHLRQ